jgi:integrase
MGKRRRKKYWSYSAGERGRNRVRAFEDHKSGYLVLEWREKISDGVYIRRRRTLGHRDQTLAKQMADGFAAEIAAGCFEDPEDLEDPEELKLQTLFEKYLREKTSKKARRKREHDHTCARMFLRFYKPDREALSLNVIDWDRFVEARRSGKAGPSSRAVGNRQIEYDLRWLLAVLNWATLARDGEGGVLLERNPLKGLKLPVEKNPARPVLTEEQYRALLAVSNGIDWRFRLALILAHETGHRIGSIRKLKWSDIDLEDGHIHWRGEEDKIDNDHTTPISGEDLAALVEERRQRPTIGATWVFPAPQSPRQPCSHDLMGRWWRRAEKLAGLEPVRRRGWHSLRRKFASELKDIPLADLRDLGGWQDHNTILKCYQRPDEERMREAQATRRRNREKGVN